MATYLGKHGSKIQNYTTNPDNQNEGEVWYNETDNVLKFVYPNVTSAGAWSTANSGNTARSSGVASGTQTSSIVYGGFSNPPLVRHAQTESYNGTNWTEVNDLGTARNALGGAGASNTSALAFGGYAPPGNLGITESWNGSNWT